MAVDDYLSHFAPVMNIQFAPASATPTVTLATNPGTLSGWSHVHQPSYLSGQFNARCYVFTRNMAFDTGYFEVKET